MNTTSGSISRDSVVNLLENEHDSEDDLPKEKATKGKKTSVKVKTEPGASKKASNNNKATANKTKAHREQQKPKKLATEEEDAVGNGKNKLTSKEVFSNANNLNTI